MDKNIYHQRLELMNWREGLTVEQKKKLLSYERGFEGEKLFGEFLRRHEKKQWKVMHDVNLKTQLGHTQLDYLVLTDHTIYLFEVKNYQCDCVWNDGQWYFADGHRMDKNFTHQLQQSKQHLTSIFKDTAYPPKIIPCLVFVNAHYQVQLYDKIDVTVLNEWQIASYLKQIPSNTHLKSAQINYRRIKDFLNPAAEYFFMPNEPWQESYRRRIYCQACHEFLLEEKYRSFICLNCGLAETKKSLVKRLTKEYCLLFLKEYITTSAIDELGNGELGVKLIYRYLSQNYDHVSSGRHRKYRNPYYRTRDELLSW